MEACQNMYFNFFFYCVIKISGALKVSDVWTCVSDLTIISLRSKCQLFTLTKFPMACALESRSSRQLAVRSLFLLRSVEPCSSWELDLKKSGKLKASFPPFLRPMPNIYPLASRNKKPTTRAKSSSVYFKRLRVYSFTHEL